MELLEELKKVTSESCIFVDEPMSKHTSFKTGGKADFLVTPKTKEEIVNILKLDAPKTIIGNGSNLLVRDGGIRGIVLKVSTNDYKIEDTILTADAGCSLAGLSNIAMQNSLSGLEFACGIPGTLGGAIYMNAGAYGSEMKNIVLETEVLNYDGTIETVCEHCFDYRYSIFQNKDCVILSSKMKLNLGEKEVIKASMDEIMKARREKQPIDKPSAGSTFKRPAEGFAGKYIEMAGLKGYRIGGAEVSTLHAGFVINAGNATSKDILDLIEVIKEKVYEKFQVLLEPEIRIIGEEI